MSGKRTSGTAGCYTQRSGQAEMIEWFPRIILLAIAIMVVIVLTNYYANRQVDAFKIEGTAQLFRIYYGDVINYHDSVTKRVYPGVIDIASFTQERVSSAFPGRLRKTGMVGKSNAASCMTLSSKNGPYVPRAICTDEQTYKELLPQAMAAIAGPQGPGYSNVTLPVTIKDGEKYTPGELNIVVVWRGS